MADDLPGTGVTVDIKADLTQSANTFTENCSKGLSRLYSSLFGKRETEITRHRMLTAAQTESDLQLIRTGRALFQNGVIVPIEGKYPDQPQNLLEVEAKQEHDNMLGNICVAIDVLSNTQDEFVSDTEVDPDFVSRWRREAKVIGNSELQQLWGRLLAEEIKEPGFVSFKSLDILKNITSNEARLFVKVAPFVMNTGYLLYDFKDTCLTFSLADIWCLQEAGLIHFSKDVVGVSRVNALVRGQEKMLTTCKGYVFVSKGNEEHFNTPGLGLTSVGKAILKICDHEMPTHEQIEQMSKILTSAHSHNITRLTVHKLLTNDGFDPQIIVYDSHPE